MSERLETTLLTAEINVMFDPACLLISPFADLSATKPNAAQNIVSPQQHENQSTLVRLDGSGESSRAGCIVQIRVNCLIFEVIWIELLCCVLLLGIKEEMMGG